MKRSTSYLATASAMRSAPSTWTSSREKFLYRRSSASPPPLFHDQRLHILRWVVAADQVVDDVGVADRLLDGGSVPQVVFLFPSQHTFSALYKSRGGRAYDEDDPAEVTGQLEMALGHLLTVGNHDRASLPRYIQSSVSASRLVAALGFNWSNLAC